MAIEPKQREMPEYNLVSHYGVERVGKHSELRIVFVETVGLMTPPTVVESSYDVDEDGAYETFVLPDFEDAPVMEGREVELEDGTHVGVIEQWDNATTTATLGTGYTSDLTGHLVCLRDITAFGTHAHRQVERGTVWERVLNTETEEALDYLRYMIASAHVEAVMAILEILGDTSYDETDISAAVAALAEQGDNLDTYLARAAERLEQDARAGNLPWLAKGP